MPVLAVTAAAVAGLSALVVAPAPSYDPWMWLLWGREVTALELSTAEGPAFKPLPVAVCALLAPLGGPAPEAWVIVARTGAVLAVLLGFRLARRLAGTPAGVAAAAGVALCGGFLGYAAAGAETGWVIAFALLGVEAWRAGRPRAALACGVACALLRVEAWPFLLAFGVMLWRRRPAGDDPRAAMPRAGDRAATPARAAMPRAGDRAAAPAAAVPVDRRLLVACAVAVPVLWLVPEWLGSGDLLRSGARARVPNPGQPALADVPALAALEEAAALPLWPLWIGAAAVPFVARAARPLLAAGLAWIALVAAMAQAGFSGEPRYSLPGAALVAIAAAAAIKGRAPALVAGLLLLVAAAPKLADLPDLRREQAWQQGLAGDLTELVEAVGTERVLGCGRPYVGNLRGPLLAYHLRVEKRRVAFAPRPPGAVFRSRLHATSPVEPPTPAAFETIAAAGRWELRVSCARP